MTAEAAKACHQTRRRISRYWKRTARVSPSSANTAKAMQETKIPTDQNVGSPRRSIGSCEVRITSTIETSSDSVARTGIARTLRLPTDRRSPKIFRGTQTRAKMTELAMRRSAAAMTENSRHGSHEGIRRKESQI